MQNEDLIEKEKARRQRKASKKGLGTKTGYQEEKESQETKKH